MGSSSTHSLVNHGLPIGAGRYQGRFRRDGIFRITSSSGSIRFYFLPRVVLKHARTPGAKQAVKAETAAARRARQHPFWRDLASAGVGLGSFGKMQRRFRPTDGPDWLPVRETLEGRLTAALDYPFRSMLAYGEQRSLFGRLGPDERAAIAGILGPEAVLRTSLHGDMHLWNFVARGSGYRLIDWEYFDENGSFVYDFLDFHVAASYTTGNGSWIPALSTVTEGHPVFQTVSGRTGASVRALTIYYLLIKIDTLFRMKPHWPETERKPLVALLRKAIT